MNISEQARVEQKREVRSRNVMVLPPSKGVEREYRLW